MLDKIILLVGLLQAADSLKCHLCSGGDEIPTLAKNTISGLDPVEAYGNCSSTSGGNVCTNGTFCLKEAITYQLSVNNTIVKWNALVKNCVTKRVDNDGIPSNTCYEDSTQITNGFNMTMKHCYCNKDFCNGVTTKQLSVTIVSSIIMLFVYKSSIF